MLSTEAIKTYTEGLTGGHDKKKKVKTALTRFMEYQKQHGLDSASESDIASFMSENAGKWQQSITYENHIRDYFGFPKVKKEDKQLNLEMTDTLQGKTAIQDTIEEGSNISMEETITLQSEDVIKEIQREATEHEPVEEKKTRRGVRRVQVSVYLMPETYDVLHTLSSVTHDSVSDMLSKAGNELAKKNQATAEQVRERLQGFKVEY